MGFENGNSKDGKHYWLTPKDLMKDLESEFDFDFDHALIQSQMILTV